MLEGLALIGTFCGMLAVAGVHHVSVFALAYLCYLSLFLTGQRWLSFQWGEPATTLSEPREILTGAFSSPGERSSSTLC